MTNKKDIMINLRLENKLKNNFKLYCKKNGFSISKRLRILIENDINGKIKIK